MEMIWKKDDGYERDLVFLIPDMDPPNQRKHEKSKKEMEVVRNDAKMAALMEDDAMSRDRCS